MTGDICEQRLHLDFDGDSIAMVYASPQHAHARNLVLMLHGGPGGQKDGPEGLYSNLARAIGRKGIASLRFDFRGVGESSGHYRDMTISRQVFEYEAVWTLARSLGFDRVGVIGESYGATIVLRSTVANPNAVCLLWPAIYFLDVTFAPFVTPEKMDIARRDGFTVEDGEQLGLGFLEEVFAIENVEDGVRHLKAPTLLIHGTADGEVPVRQSERAYELLSEPKRLITVEGGDHCLRRSRERDLVSNEVVQWLDQHL
ncbi:alpha/beta hydrolase family protein [Nonomuraea sp. NPDC004702]